MAAGERRAPRVVPIVDERSPLAEPALAVIRESVWEVQPAADLLAELEETRLRMPSGGDYHMLALVDPDETVVAAAAGVYLEAVNAGFVTYLAVREEHRRRRLGRGLRQHLVEALRTEARRRRGEDLACVVGEVRAANRWLRTLVQLGRAVPFEVPYFHPWMPLSAEGKYVLYREPVADLRPHLPAAEVAATLYSIWRRAYRVRYPLRSETFRRMLRFLEERETAEADPDFTGDPADSGLRT